MFLSYLHMGTAEKRYPFCDSVIVDRSCAFRVDGETEVDFLCHLVDALPLNSKCVAVDSWLVIFWPPGMSKQAKLMAESPHVIVATPGRLADHLRNGTGPKLNRLRFLVLDEADCLLQLGFAEELAQILEVCLPL